MAARTREKYRMPIPKREVELRSSGSGPVITYYLSQEELEQLRQKNGPACGLTKLELIKSIAAGETLSSIERAWGMKYNTIHTWVKSWGLKGINPEKAREILEMGEEHIGQTDIHASGKQQQEADTALSDQGGKETHQPSEDQGTISAAVVQADPHSGMYESRNKAEEIAQLTKRMEDYKTQAVNGWSEVERLQEEYKQLAIAYDELNEERQYLLQKLTSSNSEKKVVAASSSLIPFPMVNLSYALIDFGGNSAKQLDKVKEEANEYVSEAQASDIDLPRAVSELFDAGQAFVGLIRKKLQELCVEDVDRSAMHYFELHNQHHLAKMADKLKHKEGHG